MVRLLAQSQPMTLLELQKIRRTRAERLDLQTEFYCRPRRRKLKIEQCLEDYLNANAFEERRSACFRCSLGCANRQNYSEGS